MNDELSRLVSAVGGALIYSALILGPLLLYRWLKDMPLIPPSDGKKTFHVSVLLASTFVFGGMSAFAFYSSMPYFGVVFALFNGFALYGYIDARRSKTLGD